MNSRCFCWFPTAILVYQNGAPIWRLHKKLYKGAWNVSANNSETVGNKNLRLGQIVYVLVFLPRPKNRQLRRLEWCSWKNHFAKTTTQKQIVCVPKTFHHRHQKIMVRPLSAVSHYCTSENGHCHSQRCKDCLEAYPWSMVSVMGQFAF